MKRIIARVLIVFAIGTLATYAALRVADSLPQNEDNIPISYEEKADMSALYIQITDVEDNLIKGTVINENEHFENGKEIIVSYPYNFDITQFMPGAQIMVEYRSVLDGVVSANNITRLETQL